MPRIKTFYDELNIGRDATAVEIKHAFKEIAKIYHPDKNPPDKQAWAHEQMSRLNFVVETLLHPDTRREYDDLIRKYEEALEPRPKRPPREQWAIEREYGRVSVEIMNLNVKYSIVKQKMVVGATVGAVAFILHLIGYFTTLFDSLPVTFLFTYFFSIVGTGFAVMGLSDFLRRGKYLRRIEELEERRRFLRERMYEAYVS